MKQIIHSPEEMHKLGMDLAESESILFLVGDLGAGKTTFTKGFAEGLGINPTKVQSPTYTYVNIYDEKLLHIDLYRLDSFEDMLEKGIMDLINEYEYILIEWPKWIDKLNLPTAKTLNIKKAGDNDREVELFL